MKWITADQLPSILARLPENPRIIASGNFATPRTLLDLVDAQVSSYTLHMLNAQPGIPDRESIDCFSKRNNTNVFTFMTDQLNFCCSNIIISTWASISRLAVILKIFINKDTSRFLESVTLETN